MNKWYILSMDEEKIVGPFSRKDRAMLYMGWDSSIRDGVFYKHRKHYLGKKGDFIRAAYGYAFKSYAIETPKPLENVPGWRW